MSGLRPEIERQAAANMERLSKARMPGDGMVLGVDATGERAVQVLWLVSEDPRLQRRILDYSPRLRSDEDSMRVVFKDDPDVPTSGTPNSAKGSVSYPAMLGKGNLHVVSNGIQTEPVLDAFLRSQKIDGPATEMLAWNPYSDEAGTPRLAGVLSILPGGEVDYSIMIARKAGQNGHIEHMASPGSLREHLVNGVGVGAYEGMDADARRFIMPIGANGADTTNMYKEALGLENLSALAVKEVDIATQGVEYTFFSRPGADGHPNI